MYDKILIGYDGHEGGADARARSGLSGCDRRRAAGRHAISGELRLERLRGAPSATVIGFLERLEQPVRAVYEAGPTGFGLARAASERGLDLRVIAPGSIPRAPGDRVKTDRRDAKRLVRLFAAGRAVVCDPWSRLTGCSARAATYYRGRHGSQRPPSSLHRRAA